MAKLLAAVGGCTGRNGGIESVDNHSPQSLPALPARVDEYLLKRIIVYPGTFDPPTNGHLDLVNRGAKIFDELVVAVLRNSEKTPLFSLDERLEMLEELVKRWDNVRVDTFDGLLVDYARGQKATAVLRGIRAVSDYEYELQMALMNRKLDPALETIFMMPAEAYSYLSSRLVREIGQLGGSVEGLVPQLVLDQLHRKIKAPGSVTKTKSTSKRRL